ncbi:Uncharacterised protein [uncultured archaeon]|nr:Uncharacterised protein [uncultured archaeon]
MVQQQAPKPDNRRNPFVNSKPVQPHSSAEKLKTEEPSKLSLGTQQKLRDWVSSYTLIFKPLNQLADIMKEAAKGNAHGAAFAFEVTSSNFNPEKFFNSGSPSAATYKDALKISCNGAELAALHISPSNIERFSPTKDTYAITSAGKLAGISTHVASAGNLDENLQKIAVALTNYEPKPPASLAKA